jgi:hypothetical protein
VNDVIVIGDAEPQTWCEDNFVGDGFTGNFPLRHKVFDGASAQMLTQPWSDSSIPTDIFAVNDPLNMFQMAGTLNAIGSGSEIGQTYILANNGIELGGNVIFQHGEYTFSDATDGLLGTIYSDPSNLTLPFSVAGFAINPPVPPTTLVPSISGAAGLEIRPVFAGRIYGSNMVRWSEDFTQTSWAKTPGGTVTVGPQVTHNFAAGPPGSGIAFADRVTMSLQGKTGSSDTCRLIGNAVNSAGLIVGTLAAGERYTASVWVKTNDGTTKNVRIEPASGVSTVFTVVTGQWQRVSMSWTSTGAGSSPGLYFGLRGNTGFGATSDTVDLLIAGAQVERGLVVNGYDSTGAIASNPLYVGKTKINCHYQLQTNISGSRWDRYSRIFRNLAGSKTYGGNNRDASVTFTLTALEIPLANPLAPTTLFSFSFTGDQSIVPPFGVYAPLSVRAAAMTLSDTMIAEPPQVMLQVAGFYGPTGGQLPMLPSQRGAYSPYVVGFGMQGQVATVGSLNGDADQIQFYANAQPVAGQTGLPAVGSRIKLRSWMSGAAVGRVRDSAAIAGESMTAGDDGVRAAIISDSKPLPRTSEECEWAAAALISDRKTTQFQGNYQVLDLLWDTYQDIPRPGRMFYCHAPIRGCSQQNLIVSSVKTQVLELKSERMSFVVSFGPDLHSDKLMRRFVKKATPDKVMTPQDAARRPTPVDLTTLGTVWLADLKDATISDWNADTFTVDPKALSLTGAIEIRRTDASWGASGQNLLYSSASVAPVRLNRLAYDQTVYVRMVSATGNGPKSRFATKLRLQAQLRPAAPTYTIDWTDVFHPVLVLDFGANNDIRNISVVEARLSDNITPFYQKVYGSSYDLRIPLDNTGSNRTINVFAYFATLNWDYSPGVAIVDSMAAPVVASTLISETNESLVIMVTAGRTTATRVEYQIYTDVGLTNLSASGMVGTAIPPGQTGTVTIPLPVKEIVQQRWVRVRTYDALGASGWSTTYTHTYTAQTLGSFDNVNNIDSVPAQTNTTTDPPNSGLPGLDPGDIIEIRRRGRGNRMMNLE